jgi:hypothetical protein
MTFQSLLAPRLIANPLISATAFYQVATLQARWVIVKRTNGHVFCVCRSESEALQLARVLNRDQNRHPQEHLLEP